MPEDAHPSSIQVIASPSFKAFCDPENKLILSLIEPLNHKQYTLKDTSVKHRVLNYWMNEGIIPDTRSENPNGWHRLSLVDLVWLEAIEELRGFGLSMEKLRNAYQTLFLNNGKPSHKIETAFAFCMARINIFIVVFSDGTAGIATDYCIEQTDLAFNCPSYVRISVNSIIQKIYPKSHKELETVDRELRGYDLTPAEIQVVGAIRAEEDSEVRVFVRKNDVSSFDVKKKADPKQRIAELISQINFGEINLKIENGKVVSNEVKKKRKTC